jgi:hypothetical protein
MASRYQHRIGVRAEICFDLPLDDQGRGSPRLQSASLPMGTYVDGHFCAGWLPVWRGRFAGGAIAIFTASGKVEVTTDLVIKSEFPASTGVAVAVASEAAACASFRHGY